MDKKKHYLVYKTTCLINGKIYIGQHQTYDPNDNYLGSGTTLKEDIEKFGRENFKREILFDFDTFTDMDNKERELVTEEFINREDTYNLMVGGQNEGWYCSIFSLNRNNPNIENIRKGSIKHHDRLSSDLAYKEDWIKKVRLGLKIAKKECPQKFIRNHWNGRHHTDETKAKMREKAKMRVGEKNSASGTVWIYHEHFEQNKMVKKEEAETFLKQGWKLGRKMSFHK